MQRKSVSLDEAMLLADSLLFIILYCVLSFNARLASDDFYYLWLKNSHGAFGGMMFQYENWSGRWSAHWVACALLAFWKNPLFLPMFHLTTLAALYLCIRSSIKKSFLFLSVDAGGIYLPALSIVFITGFFFATNSIGESWFWYIIVITYLWSLICFLFVINFIFADGKKYYWLAAIGASAFIGGASESLALTFIVIVSGILIFLYRKNGDRRWITRSAVVLVIITASFFVSYVAPGTAVRQAQLPHTDFLFKLGAYVRSVGKYILIYIPGHAGYLFIFSFPWLLFGNRYLKNILPAEVRHRIFRISTLVYLSLVLIAFVPTVYVMSNAGPDRAMIFITFITVLYAAVIFTIVGTFTVTVLSFRYISVVVGFITVIVLTIFLITQTEITSAFTHEYDQRMRLLSDEKNNHRFVSLELLRLPEPGMLYWEEISADTSYFTNQHLEKGLGLPFKVKLKKE